MKHNNEWGVNANGKASSMSFCSSISFLLHSALQEIRRRGCSYCLSFFSVMIVVAASAVSQSIIDRAPIIFLQSAEGPASQTDIMIWPTHYDLSGISSESPAYQMALQSPDLLTTTVNLLNLTRVRDVLNDSRAEQITPRRSQTVKLISCASVFQTCDILAIDAIRSTNKNISDGIKTVEKGFEGNQVDESEWFVCSKFLQGLISSYQHRIGKSHWFREVLPVRTTLVRRMYYFGKVKIGDYIIINGSFYDFYAMYQEYWEYEADGYNPKTYSTFNTQAKFAQTRASSSISIPVKIKGLLDQTFGKFSDGSTDRLVIIEHKTFFKNLAYWGEDATYSVSMYDANPDWFVDEALMNLPDRLDVYLDSDYENIQFKVTQFASQVARDLGVYPISMRLPILSELYNNRYAQMFLGIILNMIIVILFLLSVFLLYNLLLISVETKTYEMGVLRVLGFNKLGVVLLILTQALSYVLPAIVFGLILSIPFLYMAATMLNQAIGVNIDIYPSPNAIGLALGLGFLIPMFSAIVPIKEALKQQLSFALDLNRSKSQAVKIEIDVSGQGIPWGRISFALISSMFGISIYFLLPLALLSFNIGLLLAIFFVLLCAMLLGFVLLAFNFQYLMERLIVFIFFFFAGAATKNLILKNLATHRIKNSRTALMFSLSIAFVIFIVTGMTVQIQNSVYSTIQKHGTYMEVYVPARSDTYLPVYDYEELLTTKLGEHIQNYAWITQPLQPYMQSRGYQSVYMTHIGKVYQYFPQVVGVSPQLFSLGFNEYLSVYERGSNTGLNPVEELYTARGSQGCIIGKAYADNLNLDTNYNTSFLLVVYNNTYTRYHEMRATTILNTAPALTYSKIPSVMVQSVAVSLPTYLRLSNQEIISYESLPMQRLLLQFTPNADKDLVFQTLKEKIDNDPGYYANIWDYRDNIKSLEQNQNLIQIIFTALTAIVMALCFFSLSSSMSANLMEQVKEISVLRAIGNSKFTIVRLYVYEAFVLVLSSSVIGLFVGFAIGYTMALQQTLITQLPMAFYFPWQMLVAIFLVSIVTAVLSTVFPAQRILGQEIAQIMRMN